jgi:general secretion pathway protein C
MPYVNNENMQRLCALANLALITLGAYFAVSIFYQLIGLQIQPSYAQSPAEQSSPVANVAAAQPVHYYRPILDRDLFQVRRTPQTAATAPAVVLENLERTQLSLKLWGTVSGDPQQTYAVIEDLKKREQNLYRIGDMVQNATVKMILREKVVLNFDGKDEVLDMADFQQSGGPVIASRGRPQVAPPTEPPPGMPAEGEQRITLQRTMLEESLSDINKLMTEIAIGPNMEEGESAGLALSRIAPNSIFRRMGLRNGDVLLGINGQQVQSPEDAMRMYESFRSSNEIQLQLKRRGQERTILYNIR